MALNFDSRPGTALDSDHKLPNQCRMVGAYLPEGFLARQMFPLRA